MGIILPSVWYWLKALFKCIAESENSLCAHDDMAISDITWYLERLKIPCRSSSQSYLAASSLRPISRLSPCSSSTETLRLCGLRGSGLSSSRGAGNSSTNLPRKRLASSSSIPLTPTAESYRWTAGLQSQVMSGVLKFHCSLHITDIWHLI